MTIKQRIEEVIRSNTWEEISQSGDKYNVLWYEIDQVASELAEAVIPLILEEINQSDHLDDLRLFFTEQLELLGR